MNKEQLKAFFEQRAADLIVAGKRFDLPEKPGNIQGLSLVVNQAQERLAQGWLDYQQHAIANMGLLILRGDETAQRKFANLAESLGGTINVDTEHLFLKLTSVAWASMAGFETFTVHQLSMVMNDVRNYARSELGWMRFHPPTLYHLLTIPMKSHSQLAGFLRDALFAENGNMLLDKTIFTEVTNQGLDKRVMSTIIPTVLVGVRQSEVPGLEALVAGKAVEVCVYVEPTKEDVIAAFNQLKTRVKELTTTENNQG